MSLRHRVPSSASEQSPLNPTSPAQRFIAQNRDLFSFALRNPGNRQTVHEVIEVVNLYNEVPLLQVRDTPFSFYGWKLTFPRSGKTHGFSLLYVIVFLALFFPPPVHAGFNQEQKLSMDEFTFYSNSLTYMVVIFLGILLVFLSHYFVFRDLLSREMIFSTVGVAFGVAPVVNMILSFSGIETSQANASKFFFAFCAFFVLSTLLMAYYLRIRSADVVKKRALEREKQKADLRSSPEEDLRFAVPLE